jgi:hypothetical protein
VRERTESEEELLHEFELLDQRQGEVRERLRGGHSAVAGED